MARPNRAGGRGRSAPLGGGLRGNPFGGAGAFSHISLAPGRAARIIAGAMVALTAVHTWLPGLSPWLLIGPGTIPGFELSALLTNGLITLPGSFFGVLLFAAIAGLLFFDRVRRLWYGDRVRLIAGVVGVGFALWALNQYVLPNRAYGLVVGVVSILWFGTGVERQWGDRRLLVFAGIIMLSTNIFGALLGWIWPTGVTALFGDGIAPLAGEQPLVNALLTVWMLMAGRRVLPLFNIEARKLVWLLVILDLFDLFFAGAIAGMMGLFAILLTWMLINGYHRPGPAYDRFRLWLIERRVEKRRAGFEVIDGGRTLHRQRDGVGGMA